MGLTFSPAYLNKLYDCRWQTKVIMLIQSVFFLLSFVPNVGSHLAIITGQFLPPNYWFWTVFTFSFYNDAFGFFLLDLLTVFLIDRLLSGPYHWLELLRFCALVNLTAALTSVFYLLIGYALTYNSSLLYSQQICGLVALSGGVTVLGRQMMSDKLLSDFPLGKIRYKHIPFLCTTIFVLLFITGLCRGISFFMFVNGIFIAWIYLRFFQKHSNGSYGDVNDAFTFAGFFPNHLGPPVSVVSNSVYKLLVRIKVCKRPISRLDTVSSVLSFTVDLQDGAGHPSERYLEKVVIPVVSSIHPIKSVPPSTTATTNPLPEISYTIPNIATNFTPDFKQNMTPPPPIPPPISTTNNNLA